MGVKAKDPEQVRYVKDAKKAIGNTKKVARPVAKDTNATRRKNTLRPLKNKIKPESFKKRSTNEPKGIK
jgi:hypothetical protein